MEAEKAAGDVGVVKERLTSLEKKVDQKAPAWIDKIKLKGSLLSYFISQDSNYFTKKSSNFLETSVRLGVDVNPYEKLSGEFLLNAQNVVGDPVDYTGVTTDDWLFEMELANLTFKEVLVKPFSVTIGRQNLEYGDGFLIYDGFTDSRANWITPIRSFYAIKGTYEAGPFNIQCFAAMVDKDYNSFETYLTDATARNGRRNLYGGNVRFEKENFGVWDLGLFYKDDNSDLKSDTLAVSQRGSYTVDLAKNAKAKPQLKLEGEIVEEFGRTNVKNLALTDTRQDRKSIGGHMDATFSLSGMRFSPYLKGSYIYLPGDDPDTDANEAFDPMFYGSQDWGRWFIGSINCYNMFNYNERIAMSEIGLTPTEKTRLRAQYYYVTLDRQITADAGRKWAHEVDLIFDYTPNDWLFFGAEFGYAHPMEAARAYAGDDENTTEFILWTGLNF